MLPIPKDKPQITTPSHLLDLPEPNFVLRASTPLGRSGVLTPWGVLAFGGKSPFAHHIDPAVVQRVRQCSCVHVQLLASAVLCVRRVCRVCSGIWSVATGTVSIHHQSKIGGTSSPTLGKIPTTKHRVVTICTTTTPTPLPCDNLMSLSCEPRRDVVNVSVCGMLQWLE
jgi:hypothetical protein